MGIFRNVQRREASQVRAGDGWLRRYYLPLVVMLVLTLSMLACLGGALGGAAEEEAAEEEEAEVVEEEPEPEPTPTEEPTPEPTGITAENARDVQQINQFLASEGAAFEMKVAECLTASTFLAQNAGDIGYALVCWGDYAWAEGYNPKIKLVRDKTLMEGHAYCNHRYIWTG